LPLEFGNLAPVLGDGLGSFSRLCLDLLARCMGGQEELESLNGRVRFSARAAKAHRSRTGPSAADYAKLVGVSLH
jgi:hypothetical protein